ncbi:hypothetical protein M569_16086 [Genlisea aurea]|uniref:Uncharacterized protein n=1 Tax=Genlisea aurea TaxID=192259 RepID=S8BWI3_9LAMI|nr:hypothetical protein M569_16086 [Genlisea aurea]
MAEEEEEMICRGEGESAAVSGEFSHYTVMEDRFVAMRRSSSDDEDDDDDGDGGVVVVMRKESFCSSLVRNARVAAIRSREIEEYLLNDDYRTDGDTPAPAPPSAGVKASEKMEAESKRKSIASCIGAIFGWFQK